MSTAMSGQLPRIVITSFNVSDILHSPYFVIYRAWLAKKTSFAVCLFKAWLEVAKGIGLYRRTASEKVF
jgi:hypothetical protein